MLKFQSTHRVNIGLIIKDQMRKAEKLQQAYAAEKNRIKELQTEVLSILVNYSLNFPSNSEGIEEINLNADPFQN